VTTATTKHKQQKSVIPVQPIPGEGKEREMGKETDLELDEFPGNPSCGYHPTPTKHQSRQAENPSAASEISGSGEVERFVPDFKKGEMRPVPPELIIHDERCFVKGAAHESALAQLREEADKWRKLFDTTALREKELREEVRKANEAARRILQTLRPDVKVCDDLVSRLVQIESVSAQLASRPRWRRRRSSGTRRWGKHVKSS
jgi:hypothetical protein